MKNRNLALAFLSALLLPGCADPYFSIRGEAVLLIENDIRYLEKYESNLCSIKEMHENGEISRGKCLAMYYDNTENDRVKNEVAKRASYILSNPDEFDKDFSNRLSEVTTNTVDCTTYIKQNCM